MRPLFRLPVVTAGLAALLLSAPATALAQQGGSSPQPSSSALARVWRQLHQTRGLTGPASLRTVTTGSARNAAATATVSPGELEGVSAVPSSSLAWAVGFGCSSGCGTTSEVDNTLALRYDGTTWNTVASPSPGSTYSELTAVKALSDTNVWAVGDYCASNCATSSAVEHVLIEHWDGTAWRVYNGQNPSSLFNVLLSVAAISSTNIWAVGAKCNSTCSKTSTLTEHWNGRYWSNVSSPNPNTSADWLNGVSTFRRSGQARAWTVGYAGPQTLAMQWTGTKWVRSSTPSPSPSNGLLGVSSPSAYNAWSVGLYCSSCTSTTQQYKTLALHWNGKGWTKFYSPNRSTAFNLLAGVSARTSTDAWSVGYDCVSNCQTTTEADNPLAAHWNGSKWAVVALPSGNGDLYSVAEASSSSTWAVGTSCSSGCGTSTAVYVPMIDYWNGSAWSSMTP